MRTPTCLPDKLRLELRVASTFRQWGADVLRQPPRGNGVLLAAAYFAWERILPHLSLQKTLTSIETLIATPGETLTDDARNRSWVSSSQKL